MILNITKTEEQEDVVILESLDKGWQVMLYNDDVNTFEWVIECLIEVCKHNAIQAEQCSMLVHYKGQCSVKCGNMDKMMSIAQALCDRGLSSIIEPVEV